MAVQTSRRTRVFVVDFIEEGHSEPRSIALPAEEWPADRDAAVDAIRAEREGRGDEVLEIAYVAFDPFDKQLLYHSRRY